MSNNNGKCQKLIDHMAESQLEIRTKHSHVGSSCLIVFEKEGIQLPYVVPHLNSPKDLRMIADGLHNASEQLHKLADELNIDQEKTQKKDMH